MGIRLLIVDSQPLIRRAVAELLRQAPDIHEVWQAAGPRQAVEMACANRPGVVIIEPQMPDGDGLRTIRAIHEQCPSANILVLTQQEDPDEAIRFIEAGAVGYVLKDIEPEHLLSAVHHVARGEAMLNPAVARHMVDHLVLAAGHPNGETHKLNGLTDREVQVLALVAGGMSDREIARKLYLSEATVKTHLKTVYRKLGVKNRAQAAVIAVSKGIL